MQGGLQLLSLLACLVVILILLNVSWVNYDDLLLFTALAAVRIQAVPEGALGGLEGQIACPANRMRCESSYGVVFIRDDPLPDACAFLPVFWAALC